MRIHSREDAARLLRLVRLALSGAIAGAALLGILSPALGLHGLHADIFGASMGFVAVVAVKVAHLI